MFSERVSIIFGEAAIGGKSGLRCRTELMPPFQSLFISKLQLDKIDTTCTHEQLYVSSINFLAAINVGFTASANHSEILKIDVVMSELMNYLCCPSFGHIVLVTARRGVRLQ